MIKYNHCISIPFTGELTIEVIKDRQMDVDELYSDEEVQNLLDKVKIDFPDEVVGCEWEAMKTITEGNVFLGILNKAEVVDIIEENEEE